MIRSGVYVSMLALCVVLSAAGFHQDAGAAPPNAEQILLKEDHDAKEQELATAKVRQKETMASIEDATETLNECDKLNAVWESEIAVLLTNEDGQFLSAKSDYVKAFNGYFNMPRPKQREVDLLRESLTTLTKPIQALLDDANGAIVPTQELTNQIKEAKEKATLLLAGYEEPVRNIKALVVSAKAEGAKGAGKLRDALDKLNADAALSKGQELDAQVRAKQKETAERLAKAHEESLDNKAKIAEKAAKQDKQIAIEEADEEALVKLAKSPDIQKRLAPFITPGMTQFSGSGMFYNAPDEAKPLSFSIINKANALSPNERGRTKLVILATSRGNDRPKWHTPVTSQDWKWVKENQEYLRQLGPTLIELGMLLP